MKRILAGYLALAVAAVMPAPASAAQTCQRTVVIQPQMSVGEGTGTLTFAVHSSGCAAAGSVGYRVLAGGTATPLFDFVLPDGQLHWVTGDTSPRLITATITNDLAMENRIEDFTVLLHHPTPAIKVASATGHGRILDDDGPSLVWAADDGICDIKKCVCHAMGQEIVGTPTNVIQLGSNNCRPGLALSAAQPAPATVLWSTTDDGTAVAGVDYVPVTNQAVTVPVGATRAYLPLQFLLQPPGTPSRWLSIEISTPVPGQIVDDTAVITIEGS